MHFVYQMIKLALLGQIQTLIRSSFEQRPSEQHMLALNGMSKRIVNDKC